MIVAHLKQDIPRNGKYKEFAQKRIIAIKSELKLTLAWLRAFKKKETVLLQAGKKISYKIVYAAMKKSGIVRLRPKK